MTDKLMYIPNNDTLNYPFFRLKLVVETFEHSNWWINKYKLIFSVTTYTSSESHKNHGMDRVGCRADF